MEDERYNSRSWTEKDTGYLILDTGTNMENNEWWKLETRFLLLDIHLLAEEEERNGGSGSSSSGSSRWLDKGNM